MKKNKIITGLDIGSSKVSAVTASVGRDGQFTIIGHVSQDSKGSARGTIVDMNESIRAVASVLKKLKVNSPGGLGQIYVNISGQAVKGARSKGMIPISVRGREITTSDMTRCIDAASTIHLPYDREIVHKIVQKFSVDDQPWIKDPLGLYASRLACEVYIITASVNSIQNIFKCVNSAGYDVKEVVYTGIADGSIVLTKEDTEAGVLLLSIGASLTEISVFIDGALCDIEIMQAGTADFQGELTGNAVFDEVISKVLLKMQDFRKAGNNLQLVSVTGGIVFADGAIEYLEEKLLCEVKMGVSKDVRGEMSGLDSVRLCTAIGLAKYAAGRPENLPQGVKSIIQRVSSSVVDIFNNYF